MVLYAPSSPLPHRHPNVLRVYLTSQKGLRTPGEKVNKTLKDKSVDGFVGMEKKIMRISHVSSHVTLNVTTSLTCVDWRSEGNAQLEAIALHDER